MTCEGELNSVIAMSAPPTLGLLPHAVCNASVCPSASHISHSIPLIPLNPTYPGESHLNRGESRLIPVNPGMIL